MCLDPAPEEGGNDIENGGAINGEENGQNGENGQTSRVSTRQFAIMHQYNAQQLYNKVCV
jgi:hypothetical protein